MNRFLVNLRGIDLNSATLRNFLMIFSILFVLIGCAAQERVRPQAIQPETKDLSEIEHKLVFLSVDIEQGKTRLRMKRLVARNQETQKIWVFPFYDNLILDSTVLAFTQKGSRVEHLVFLDIPEGTYRFTKADFEFFQYNIVGANTTQLVEHELFTPVYFEVKGGQATYLGNLNVKIVLPNELASGGDVYTLLSNDQVLQQIYPAMTLAALDATKTTLQTLGGFLYFSAPGGREIDLQEARGRYPALINTDFTNGRIWTE
jgi:hypothetical protein